VEGQNIIIKKVKKNAHGGHHGGSWKVAYADFVTAMMAFFLLLWLITMTAPEKRARVANYFKYFSMFDKGGSSMLEMNKTSSLAIVDNDSQDQANGSSATQPPGKEASDNNVTDDDANMTAIANKRVEDLAQKLKRDIEKKLADVKDQIMVDAFEGGVRIELIDKDGGRSMFPLGSTDLTPEGKKILEVIAQNIQESDCKVALEGHTDARRYSTGNYSNWELSTGRASAARRELERDGMLPNNLLRVAGYAATEPLIKTDPYDPRNRRISIVLFSNMRSTPPDASTASGKNDATGQSANPASAPNNEETQKNDTPKLDPIQQYLFGEMPLHNLAAPPPPPPQPARAEQLATHPANLQEPAMQPTHVEPPPTQPSQTTLPAEQTLEQPPPAAREATSPGAHESSVSSSVQSTSASGASAPAPAAMPSQGSHPAGQAAEETPPQSPDQSTQVMRKKIPKADTGSADPVQQFLFDGR
jgi:chemotaxis protein MotB